MDSLFYYQKSRSSPLITTKISEWEEEFKKGFEKIFNSQNNILEKNDELNITNENEKNYFINDKSFSTENSNKYFKAIKEKNFQKNNLKEIELVEYLMKLNNSYEKYNRKDLKIKNLMIQKELLEILKERTIIKIENCNNTKNSSSHNTNSKL